VPLARACRTWPETSSDQASSSRRSMATILFSIVLKIRPLYGVVSSALSSICFPVRPRCLDPRDQAVVTITKYRSEPVLTAIAREF
jgi:hypothetical protein